METKMSLAEVEKKIATIVSCDIAKVCSSGNEAIFHALLISKLNGKKKVLIPDQGGWISYERYPKLLDMKVEKIKTDSGLLSAKELEKHADADSMLIFSSMAGYFALQDIEKIIDTLHKKGTWVILDVTPSFPLKELSDFPADIFVGSFGEWKPLNLGWGGFIAFKDKEIVAEHKDMFSMFKVPEDYSGKLDKELDSSPKKILDLIEKAKKIKTELSEFDIIHKERIGLNVVARFKTDEEKKKLIDYCNKKDYEFIECPKNIKVEEKAISIELKRQQIDTNK